MEVSSSSVSSRERVSKETREQVRIECAMDDTSMVSLPLSSVQIACSKPSIDTCTPVRASPFEESRIWSSIVRLIGLVIGAAKIELRAMNVATNNKPDFMRQKSNTHSHLMLTRGYGRIKGF